MHMPAALDLATGKISCRIRTRNGGASSSACSRPCGNAGPEQKLYVVPDNFSPHEHAEVRTWAADRRTHTEQNAAIATSIRRRNAHAEPKTRFALESPIRRWTDHPAKAA